MNEPLTGAASPTATESGREVDSARIERRWSIPAAAPAVFGVAVALFVVRLLGAPWSGGFPTSFPDSASYLEVARLGPFRSSFWLGERPIGAPLLYWSLGRNVRLIVLAQTAISVASFTWTAIVVKRTARAQVLGILGALLVIAVGVQPRFALWNTQVLSESLSISFGVLALGAWLNLAREPTPRRVLGGWLATLAFALTRDANMLVVFLFVGSAAALASRWWQEADSEVRRRLRVGSMACALVALLVVAGQESSGRTRYPVFNVIGQRVLGDERVTAHYVAWGMPLDEAVRGRLGRTSWDDGEAFLRAPELAGLRDWVAARGQYAQVTSWVRFAPEYIPTVWHDLPAHLATEHESYDLFGVHDRLPESLGPREFGGPRSRTGLLGWLATAALGAIGMWLARRRAILVVCLTGLLATAADLYVSWLGDSVEVQRHLVGAVARLGVVLVAFIALGFDDWNTFVSRRFRGDRHPLSGDGSEAA